MIEEYCTLNKCGRMRASGSVGGQNYSWGFTPLPGNLATTRAKSSGGIDTACAYVLKWDSTDSSLNCDSGGTCYMPQYYKVWS